MKKKISLIVLIIAISGSNIFTQSLPNTTWAVYNTSSTFFAHFHFGNDTLLKSIDNITYSPVSKYWENGNNFIIFDVPPTPCSTDTGKYTFSIQNDTLDFTLISDNCTTGRSSVIANYYWVNLTADISLLNSSTTIKIYPNPITNGIVHLNINEKLNHNCLISIFSFNGAKIYEENISTPSSNEVNLKNIVPGIYLIKVFDEEKSYIRKIIVE